MLGNWIKQTSTSTGTGNLTLSAVTGFPTFSNQFAVGEYFYYTVLNDSDGTPIESGIGHMSDSATLVRDKPLATFVAGTYNDNDPAAVTLAAGTKRVICSMEQGALLAAPNNIPTVNSTYRSLYPTGLIINTTPGVFSLIQDIVYYIPILLNTPRTIDAVQFRLYITGAGSSAYVGIYSAGLDGKPLKRLDVSSSIDTSTTSGVKTGALTKRRYKPGLYYIAISTTGGTAPQINQASTSGSVNPLLGGDSVANIGGIGGYYEAAGSGILPATANTTLGVRTIAEIPLVSLRLT